MNWPQITWIVRTSLKLALEAFRVFVRTEHLPVRAGTFLVHMAWVFFAAVLPRCGSFSSQVRAAQPPQTALWHRDDAVRNARLGWGLSMPVADFVAQLHQESGWRPDAISPVGAQGLAQFVFAATDWMSQLTSGLNSREPSDPVWAVRALANYDRRLWQRVSTASGCERMTTTLSGYNGGLGWVQRDRRLASQKRLDSTRWFDHVATVSAGHGTTSWRENYHYPQRILLALAPRYLSWGGASCVGT